MQKNVLDYLENSSIEYPNKTAIISGNYSVSYKELKHLSLAISNEIIENINYTKNQPILVYLPKSIEAIVSMLGSVYSGNFYTPTSTDFPPKKLESIIKSLEPKLIITNSKYEETLIQLKVDKSKIIFYDKIDFKKETSELKHNYLNTINTDLIYTYFTSGSTGVPKGVTINHRNVINFIDEACSLMPLDKNSIVGNQSSLHFDITTQDLYATLKNAATLVIIPEHLFSFPTKLIEYIDEKNINFIFWVPSAFINVCLFKALDKSKLSKLTSIMFAGEVMPVKYYNEWKRNLPNLKFAANAYGPTETTVDCTYYIIDREYDDSEEFPLGYPIKNTEVILLDKSNNLVTRPDIQGELCVLGTSLSPGYWRNKEKTDEAFVQNPLHNNYEEKMYRTGDLAKYNKEGLIVFCGRKDNQIKHLGYRIELGEIETASLSLSFISNCIAFYNESKRQITLAYTSNKEELAQKDIKLALTNLLPKYMVPTKYHQLEEMPINVNGKIDRVLIKSNLTRINNESN